MITIKATGDTTLHTAGKYCEEDILVKVPEAEGVELPELTNEGSASDLLSGKELIDGNGSKVTGTFTIDNELMAQDDLISQIQAAVDSLPEAGGGSGSISLQDKIIEPNKTQQLVTADAEYDGLYSVTVKPIGDEYIIPEGTYSINTNGSYDIAQYTQVAVNVPSSGGGGDSSLPAGYSRVDFIEFNGKQLVDTGLIGNQDTRIRTSFTWGSSTQNHVYGCASSDNTASITSYTNGSWRFGAKSATKTVAKNNTTLPYSAYVDKTTIGVTGSVTAISGVADFETIGTMLLGGARSSNGALPSSGIVGRILFFYVWDGDTQVQKLVPVTDGTVYRFWDEVGRKFHDSITDTPLSGGNL